eukprot:gene6130-6835_t
MARIWKIQKCSTLFVVLGITIVIFFNVFISLSLYQNTPKTCVFGCVGRHGSVEASSREVEASFGTNKASTVKDKLSTKPVLNPSEDYYGQVGTGQKDSVSRRQKVQSSKKPKHVENACPVNKITPKYKKNVLKEEITCLPHRPSAEACLFAEKLYPFNKTLLDCPQENSMEFCTINREEKVACIFPTSCERLIVTGINKDTGLYHTKGIYTNRKELEEGVTKIISEATLDGFNFVFIGCIDGHFTTQLLSWVPRVQRRRTRSNKQNKVNVNIVLLDSISRAHFYRSLPHVIEEFERLNKNKLSPAEILDFSLFQSVDGHTLQNSRALFTGELLPEGISEEEKEKVAVGIEILFEMFKKAGYKTLYHDDLCWSYVWGLRKELGIPRTWKQFQAAIKSSNIDDTGLTFANCRILKDNGLRNPFSESKNNQLCFGSKFQHDYILEYSAMFHETSVSPTISFTSLNTAHDWHGLRTQTLNKGLVNYVRRISTLKNTITIIMADHGNTYTPYVRKILEGRYEMYHPSLFMVIPKTLANNLGNGVMSHVRANQNRLLTMLDIHFGLKSLAHLSLYGAMPVGNGGFLNLISKTRTCNDLEMRLPNLCVCEGWDTEAANDTNQVSVLEFGVGVLNNKIEEQRYEHYKKIGHEGDIRAEKKCNYLVPVYFKNVRERNIGDNLITVFDFVVKSGGGIDQKEEIFHVEVQSIIKPGVVRDYINLLSFDRLSRYGPYSKCADKGVDLRLCVCSLVAEKEDDKLSIGSLWKLMPRLPSIQSNSMLYSKVNDNCIYIFARYYYLEEFGKIDMTRLLSSTLHVINFCSNVTIGLEVDIHASLMKISTSSNLKVIVHENDVKFLCLLSTENQSWPTSFTFIYRTTEL